MIALTKQLTGRESIEELRQAAGGSETVLLPTSALARIIEAYIAGGISSAHLADLAEVLEAEAVEYEDRVVADVLFELGTPEINGDISESRCREILDLLRNCHGGPAR